MQGAPCREGRLATPYPIRQDFGGRSPVLEFSLPVVGLAERYAEDPHHIKPQGPWPTRHATIGLDRTKECPENGDAPVKIPSGASSAARSDTQLELGGSAIQGTPSGDVAVTMR